MQPKRILLALDLQSGAAPLLQQAAYLTRHFAAHLEVLHVLSAWHHPSGLLEREALSAADPNSPQGEQTLEQLQRSLHPMLEGLDVTLRLLRGHPAQEIVRRANDSAAELIMLSTHHPGMLEQLLPGGVTRQVLHETRCPIWTDAAAPGAAAPTLFAIRRILCAVDLSSNSRQTLLFAAQFAKEFGAQLTLAHVTPSVQTFGPGGSVELPEFEREVMAAARQELAELQRRCGTSAPTVIDSGDVLEALRRCAEQTGADVLIVGRMPSGGHLGEDRSGLGILRNSPIPVLSV